MIDIRLFWVLHRQLGMHSFEGIGCKACTWKLTLSFNKSQRLATCAEFWDRPKKPWSFIDNPLDWLRCCEPLPCQDGLEPVWQCGLGSLHIGTDLCHSLFAILCGCKIRKLGVQTLSNLLANALLWSRRVVVCKKDRFEELDTLNGKPGCVVSTWRQEVVENWFDSSLQLAGAKCVFKFGDTWTYLDLGMKPWLSVKPFAVFVPTCRWCLHFLSLQDWFCFAKVTLYTQWNLQNGTGSFSFTEVFS